jgi:hypothetical protein
LNQVFDMRNNVFREDRHVGGCYHRDDRELNKNVKWK